MSSVTIASSSQLSADAGAAAARHGGNAVDAAIAATIAAMVTDPGIIALGGSGFISVWPSGGEPIVIDCYAEMPGRIAVVAGDTPEVHLEYGGGMTTVIGPGSVATPGALKGLGAASSRFGSLAWSRLLEPSVSWAEDGFPISSGAAWYLTFSHEAIFGWHPESRRALHHPDGSPLREGDLLRVPGLAASLELIAREGPDVFYTGELGRRLADDNLAHGGALGRDDLADYEVAWRDPIRHVVGDWDIAVNPPPAIGGAVVVAILMLMDDCRGWTARDVRRMVEAQEAVLDYRSDHLSGSSDPAPQVADLLERARFGNSGDLLSSPSTIHVSTADDAGTACAISMSAGYGSGAMIPGSGIWLNNSLGELELYPGGPRSIPPGTRLVSNMAPTVGRRRDGAALALGTPGASRITSAMALTLFNLLRLGMSLDEAVDHPRLHVEIFRDQFTISHEPGIRVEPLERSEVRPFAEKTMYFGGVQVAQWTPDTGLGAAADSRRGGGVAFHAS